jgi:hypothetical protein
VEKQSIRRELIHHDEHIVETAMWGYQDEFWQIFHWAAY